MLRLPLTAFRMVPISSLLHCAPGKQRYLLSTSPDSYARLFLKDARILKRDGQKALKCVDHHFVRRLSTLRRFSLMDCLPEGGLKS